MPKSKVTRSRHMADPSPDAQHRGSEAAPGRVGVWLFGALGGLATTVVVGARALAKDLAPRAGMLTDTDLFRGVPLAPLDRLVFGGHEIRDGDWVEAAEEIQDADGTFPRGVLRTLRADLKRRSHEIRPGCLVHAGSRISALAGERATARKPAADLRREVERLKRDIRDFKTRNRLKRVVCVNLVSTEPALRPSPAHRSMEALERALRAGRERTVRPSTLYALAAAELGLPFVHFTPSEATLLPAVREAFAATGAPFCGRDGKTGETLVKSALAPMFRYRDLRVLAWQGYNMLGDRDGQVLDEAENKATKVASKDALLHHILGYPLHSRVAIDYVPSLGDHKTAWDFIHFQGFMGHRMAMQFTWQGCDSILAAPLVLDLVRLTDLAARRGESGALTWLASFFKSPLASSLDGSVDHDLHQQWHALTEYAAAARAAHRA